MKCAKVLRVLMVVLAVSLCCGVVYADNCANRTTAVCNGAGGAADPASDTTPTGPVGSCATGNTGGNGEPGVNDTFVEFVATATSARIRTDLNSVGTDSDFGVYSVDQDDVCDQSAWVEIGCSEDEAPPFLGDICVDGLTIGDTYIVQVGHWNDAYSGAFVVDVECGIPAGRDCWRTLAGTQVNLCNCTIPPDFFGPGCQLFDGTIDLAGAPPPQYTIVERLEGMDVGEVGLVGSTPLVMIELNMFSTKPITVICDEGEVQFDVAVSLSEIASSTGHMTVTKTHNGGGKSPCGGGGTFNSVLHIRPKLTFTRVGDPGDVRILDAGETGCLLDDLETTGAPWSHGLSFTPDNPDAICGTNFVPGVQSDPDTGSSCCVTVCHKGATATHCNEVGIACPCCPGGGACCDPDNPMDCLIAVATGRCSNNPTKPCTIAAECVTEPNVTCCVPGDTECGTKDAFPPFCPEQVCNALGRFYHGAGTDCTDSDGDLLPDVVETGGTVPCCTFDGVSCSIGTDPNNPDSDMDGINDDVEIMNGTDPCVANENIPTVSEWGVLVMTLLFLAAGTMAIRRARAAPGL